MNRSVLIGTIGYFNLRDYSIGPHLLPKLKAMPWPQGVEVDELNWGPIAIVQKFEAMPRPYDRVVLLTARNAGRLPGTITLRRWGGGLPEGNNIQARIAEAVTGVISVDNLLIIGEYFRIWPPEVFVVDVEPGAEEMGETFTPAIEKCLPDVLKTIREAAVKEAEDLPPYQWLRGEDLLF